MKKIPFILFVCIQLVSISSFAQPSIDTVPAHQTFTIESKILNEVRTMNVWIPEAYNSGLDSLPVLFMPDGGVNEDFPHVANTLAYLIQSKKIQPVILIGIENTQRRRDLTGETQNEKDKEIAPIVGGSAQFRAFINEELFTEITKRYPTKGSKGIMGESLAGLFVIETFLYTPEMFDFYIAFDPSLWWNDYNLVKTAGEKRIAFPVTKKSLWFASSGTKGIYEATDSLHNILKLKMIGNLKWEYQSMPNETHARIFRAAEEKALEWTLGFTPENKRK